MNREWIIGPVLVLFNIVSVLVMLPWIAVMTAINRLKEENE